MKKVSLVIVSWLFAANALAHEGHGHKAIEASNGGEVKEGKTLALEFVAKGSDIEIYPLSTKGEPLSLDRVKFKVTATPRGKPKTTVDFKPMGNHFMGKIDGAGKRVELQIEASQSGGASEKFKFQIEPEG